MNLQVVKIIGGGGGQNDKFAPQYFHAWGATAPCPQDRRLWCKILLALIESSNSIIYNQFCYSSQNIIFKKVQFFFLYKF